MGARIAFLIGFHFSFTVDDFWHGFPLNFDTQKCNLWGRGLFLNQHAICNEIALTSTPTHCIN